MTEANTYVTVNGHTCDRARVTVGYVGPWTAELHLSNTVELAGPVTLRIGSLTLVGAVVPKIVRSPGKFPVSLKAPIVLNLSLPQQCYFGGSASR